MKKLALLLAVLIVSSSFAACGEKLQRVESTSPIESSYSEESGESSVSDTTDITDGTSISDSASNSDNTLEGTVNVEVSDVEYINFKVDNFKGGVFEGADQIRLIKDHNQLLNYYKEVGIAITDAYSEDFFKEKAVILIFVYRGSGSIMLDIKHVGIKNGVLQVTLTERIPEIGTDDIQYRAFAIEVMQEAIKDIEEAVLITESVYTGFLFEKEPNYSEEDFNLYKYSGTLEKSEKRLMYENCGWLEIINDSHELNSFLERYTPDADSSENLIDFTDSLDDDFFNKKTIIAIPTYGVSDSANPKSYFELKEIISTDGNMHLHFYEQTFKAKEDSIQLAVVNKDSLPNKNVFKAYFNYIVKPCF